MPGMLETTLLCILVLALLPTMAQMLRAPRPRPIPVPARRRHRPF